MDTCSLCGTEFNSDSEGGIRGVIGILPVKFCPWCKSGLFDMCDQMRIPMSCPECGWEEEE